MKHIFTSIFIVIFSAGNLPAQQFINGSFEHIGTLTHCAEADSNSFNAQMGNVWVKGPGPNQVYIGDSTCGLPAHGRYFIGIEYTSLGGGDNIILKLSTPMIAGTKYKFTFSYKKSPAMGAALLYVGYNHPSDSFGHDSMVNILPAPTSTSWVTVTDSITPGVTTSFIYIRAASPGTSPLVTYLDNFGMTGVPPLAVSKAVAASDAINVYPNPLTLSGTIRVGSDVVVPYSVVIYDVMERAVVQKDNLITTEVTIDRADLPVGTYFIKVIDSNNNAWHKKLLVE